MTLGEKIKEYRKRNKYSQEKLAELVGVSRQAVTKWETNQSAPSTVNLLKLADIYGTSLDELIHENTGCSNMNIRSSSKQWIKFITILWVTISAVLIVTIVLKKEKIDINILWTLVNLLLLIGTIVGGIYLVILLVKALNKYIHS